MANTILQDLKTLLEIDLDEDVEDAELILNANDYIADLINNEVPLTIIDATTTSEDWEASGLDAIDYYTVLKYLNMSAVRDISPAFVTGQNASINNNIEKSLQRKLFQLKINYTKV